MMRLNPPLGRCCALWAGFLAVLGMTKKKMHHTGQ